jgi:heme-degrading monooxygenase HmoA
MLDLAAGQDGYPGVEPVRNSTGFGITFLYWRDRDSIRQWHDVAEHRFAQQLWRSRWYDQFAVRDCKVESEYGFSRQTYVRIATDRLLAFEDSCKTRMRFSRKQVHFDKAGRTSHHLFQWHCRNHD